jgi:hypothetical protein
MVYFLILENVENSQIQWEFGNALSYHTQKTKRNTTELIQIQVFILTYLCAYSCTTRILFLIENLSTVFHVVKWFMADNTLAPSNSGTVRI